jgi:DNA anti-recombination protein RmuC
MKEMIERTGAIEKLRREFESSVDINIDTINGLYEIIDVLIEQIQNLQKDVQSLADVFVSKAENTKIKVDNLNAIPNKDFYI